ncbi:hypothetical protein [Edaphocola aurantiacus]|uniref:hypothetical protein n=1 Tax=Edaphocola aurantiacus TaxID=2601682 RepID=UPI001C987E57|nr:hypothetical protein [Edaphocola aurantiacus]
MINNNNVQNYISYLYKRKTGNNIPDDVLESWSNLEDDEISLHLTELYNSWRIGVNDAKMMENEFIKINKPKPFIPPIQQYEEATVEKRPIKEEETIIYKDVHHDYPEPKRGFIRPWYWWGALIVIAIALLSYVSIKYIYTDSSEDDSTESYIEEPQIENSAKSYAEPIPVTSQPPVEQNENTYTAQIPNGGEVNIIGTVSVSTKGFFGTKNAHRIERQLRKEAEKLYPNNAGITNVRYEGNSAFADVLN